MSSQNASHLFQKCPKGHLGSNCTQCDNKTIDSMDAPPLPPTAPTHTHTHTTHTPPNTTPPSPPPPTPPPTNPPPSPAAPPAAWPPTSAALRLGARPPGAAEPPPRLTRSSGPWPEPRVVQLLFKRHIPAREKEEKNNTLSRQERISWLLNRLGQQTKRRAWPFSGKAPSYSASTTPYFRKVSFILLASGVRVTWRSLGPV